MERAKLEAAHLFESCYIATERSDGGLAQRGGGRQERTGCAEFRQTWTGSDLGPR